MSAALRYHKTTCPTCDGSKGDPEACDDSRHCLYEGTEGDVCPWCPDCSTCNGDGVVGWEWSEDETGPCDECTVRAQDEASRGLSGAAWTRSRLAAYRAQPDVPVAHWGEESTSVCRPCAVRFHAAQCGCDLWPKEAP